MIGRMGERPSLEELTRFGIRTEDEAAHAWSADHEWWNESWFFDWFDADGASAGHCRIGIHPVQGRLWFWLFLFDGEDWVVLEEPRLPISRWNVEALAYEDPWGLAFSYEVGEPLRTGILRCRGFGRLVSGPRAGQVQPVSVHLAFEAAGAAHSVGEGRVAGHSAEGLSTNRYEQPITGLATTQLGGESRTAEIRGERDHSWGPRWWNMEWNFLVLGDEELRLQAVHVVIPDVTEMKVGYLARDGVMSNLAALDYDLWFDDQAPTRAVRGRFRVKDDEGRELAGSIEPVSGAEIDLSHCFVPPRRSIYRRSLVKVKIEGRPGRILGWLESNRFPHESGTWSRRGRVSGRLPGKG